MKLTKLLSALLIAPSASSPMAISPPSPQVLVDPAGVYMRATRLNDNTIIAGYAAQDGPNHLLRVVKSSDTGSSWTQLGTVTAGDSATHDIDNAFPLQLPSGRILFAFRNHDRTSKGVYTYYRITVCYSDDGGVTWSFLTQIDERPANGVNGLWEPFLRASRNGTLQVFYSSENNGGDQDNVMKTSTDGGASWSGPFAVSGQGITSRDGMTAVADAGGKLMCVFENTESGPFSINYVLSYDDGFTWSSRTRLYTARNGKNAGAPYVINVGGTLVASFMTNEDTDTPNIDGGQMKVVSSSNGGQTWSSAVVTGGTGSHWEATYSLDNSHFLALYSLDRKGLVSQKYSL